MACTGRRRVRKNPRGRIAGWRKNIVEALAALRGRKGKYILISPVLQAEKTESIANPLNDATAAEYLFDHFGGSLRYVTKLKSWIVWDEDKRRWIHDDNETARHFMIETGKNLYNEWYVENREKAIWAAGIGNANRTSAALKQAASMTEFQIDHTELNADAWLLGVPGGYVDLRTKEYYEADRSKYITQTVRCNYDANATCPRFLRFLAEIFPDDRELIDWLHRYLGFCISGSVREQKFVIFHGSGRNGKSLLLDTLIRVLGERDYARVGSKNLLIASKNDRHPTEIAHLEGGRLCVTDEAPPGATLSVDLVKRLTGDRYLTARGMYQDPRTFECTFKMILATNGLPKLEENTEAIHRRLIVVPFRECFSGREDTGLRDIFEGEASGILNWLIDGCCRYLTEGIELYPATIVNATRAYIHREDNVRGFLEDECILDVEAKTAWEDLLIRYSEWASENDMTRYTDNEFRNRLVANGFERAKAWKSQRHKRTVKGVNGLRLQ